MKIQSIYNQQALNSKNISHKAYFRPSADLEKLCKNAQKDNSLSIAMNLVKTALPNHELEIQKLITSVNYAGQDLYKVINHTINKTEKFVTSQDRSALKILLNRIYLNRETFFYDSQDENITDIDIYNELTTKNE